jgi:hypothetical protein
MKGLVITRPLGMRSNAYFNMIGDDLIKPSIYSDLQEPYFNARVQSFKGTPDLKAKVKEFLKDTGSGVYFEPSWNNKLALEELGEMVAKSANNKEGTGLAWDNLANAKRFRSDALSNMKGNWALIPRNKLESQVNDSIKNDTFPKKNDYTYKGTTRDNIKAAIDAIYKWVTYQTIGDAYFKEIKRRMAIKSEVEKELLTGDLRKLKALRSKIKFEDLLEQINEEIKTIEQAQKDAANRTEEERKAKELADAEAKAKADAIKQAEAELAAAKTDDEKAAAQAKLNNLKNTGSNTTLGGNKTLLYVGIGVVVLVGAFFAFRKRN